MCRIPNDKRDAAGHAPRRAVLARTSIGDCESRPERAERTTVAPPASRRSISADSPHLCLTLVRNNHCPLRDPEHGQRDLAMTTNSALRSVEICILTCANDVKYRQKAGTVPTTVEAALCQLSSARRSRRGLAVDPDQARGS